MLRSYLLATFTTLFLLSCDTPSDHTKVDTPEGAHLSSMTIQIHRNAPPSESSPNFIANQIAILSTDNIIDLSSKKSKLDASLIKGSVVIEALKGTDLVRLTAYNDDAARAKLIVESLVEAYSDYRKKQSEHQASASLEKMEQLLQYQKGIVQDHRKALAVLTEQYGIPYDNKHLTNSIGETEEAMYRRAQKKLDQLEKSGSQLGIADRKLQTNRMTREESMYRRAQEKLDQMEQDKNRIQIHIRKLIENPDDKLIRVAAGINLPENQVTKYYDQYQTAEEQVGALVASGLGPSHPEVKATRLKSEKALEAARKEVVSLKEILETRLNLVDKQVERLEELVRDKSDLSRPLHQYTTAKEEYEQARSLYREMKIKEQEQRILLVIPQDPITIHETAK